MTLWNHPAILIANGKYCLKIFSGAKVQASFTFDDIGDLRQFTNELYSQVVHPPVLVDAAPLDEKKEEKKTSSSLVR